MARFGTDASSAAPNLRDCSLTRSSDPVAGGARAAGAGL
jgi:hypothetical protein